MNILETALSYENKTRNDLNLHASYDWCAETVMSILNNSDIPTAAKEVGTISCNQTFGRMKANDYWYEPDDDMKTGDIIFYNWGHDYDRAGNLDHIGVIVAINPTTIEVIEGNTEGRENTARVRRVTRLKSSLNFNCTYPDYYMRLKPITPTTDYNNPLNIEKIRELVKQLRDISDLIDNELNR